MRSEAWGEHVHVWLARPEPHAPCQREYRSQEDVALCPERCVVTRCTSTIVLAAVANIAFFGMLFEGARGGAAPRGSLLGRGRPSGTYTAAPRPRGAAWTTTSTIPTSERVRVAGDRARSPTPSTDSRVGPTPRRAWRAASWSSERRPTRPCGPGTSSSAWSSRPPRRQSSPKKPASSG